MEMKNKNFNRSFGFFLHSFGLENQEKGLAQIQGENDPEMI